MPHAKVLERVERCVDDGGWRTTAAGFTGALHTKRVLRRRSIFVKGELHLRHIFRAGQGVIHQRSGYELAALCVIDNLFH